MPVYTSNLSYLAVLNSVAESALMHWVHWVNLQKDSIWMVKNILRSHLPEEMEVVEGR
jgi:hypothetical protein